MAQFDFVTAALLAAGARKLSLSRHLSRLEELIQRLGLANPPPDPVERARLLLQGLWREKPHRFQPGGEFRLHRVLRHQISPRDEAVGNCLGLTLLYNALALRLGLKVGAVYLPQAFGRGPHTCSLLHTDGGTLDIENIFPDGFDYRGHSGHPERELWGAEELVAEVHLAWGNMAFEAGHLKGALREYKRALGVSPGFGKARANRMLVEILLERERPAAAC